MSACLFCELIRNSDRTSFVLEDEVSLAFLDHSPLFPGHCLLVPRAHYPTLMDLSPELVGPLFANARRLAQAIELAMGADGIFVGVNNRISQSVPHLHIHVVPRRHGDGLKGFFWPRGKYHSAAEMAQAAERIRSALRGLGD